MARGRRLVIVILAALALAASIGTTAAPVAQGAWSCRVRNVTQDAYGRSLKRMVERASDGDLLRVRGVCPGEIVIDRDLVIRGLDGAVLTGRGRTRVVRVRPGATVTLKDLIIARGGFALGGGIGINNRGILTLVDSSVRANRARKRTTDGYAKTNAAGILNRGDLTLTRTVVSRNTGALAGGGILDLGTATLIDSRVSANRAEEGGGIVSDGGTVILIDSTVSGNGGLAGGGMMSVVGTVTLIDSTVSGNWATSGGGVFNDGGTLMLTSSNVSGNSATYQGGGIWNGSAGTVTLDATSSVTGNVPDDCVGTPAC